MRLLQSLTTWPIPGPPTCTTRPAKASRAGSVSASTAASPPTMRVSVPFCAPAVPPESGASRYRAPASATRACWTRSTSGSMVEQSTTVMPGPRTGSISSTTSTTSGELGTQRTTTTEASATPRGDPPSVAPNATAASIGPRLRDATATSWPAVTRCLAIGRPMAPSPTNPMRMRVLPTDGVTTNCGSHSAVPARSSSTMASMSRRSPASGQRVEREGLGGEAAVPGERRLDGELLGGHVPAHDLVVGTRQQRDVTAADTVAVDHADRLEDGVAGQSRSLAGVGDVHRGLERLAGQHGLNHGRGQLARLPRLQVLGSGQPGIDVGHVVGLVLLAPRDRAERDVVPRTPLGLGCEREGHELGDVAVPGGGEGAPTVEQRELEEVALGEIALGELLRLWTSGHEAQRLEPADLLDQAAQEVETVSPVDLERREHREMVDAGHRRGDGLEGPAAGDGQVHAEVPHLVTEADRLDGGLPAHGAGQAGHGVGDVEEPRVRAVLLHGMADPDQDGHVAQRPVDPTRTHGVADGLGDAVGSRHVQVDRHGTEGAGRDADDDEVGAVECRPEIGGGGHRRLRPRASRSACGPAPPSWGGAPDRCPGARGACRPATACRRGRP